MENHNIPISPQFSDQLRKLKTTDPAHADTFNGIHRRLIENDAALKQMIDNIPKTPINNTLTSDSETEALSAKQGKILNETKLSNKRNRLSIEDLNNPNYPEPYVASTPLGKQMGLPTNWAFIQYFRHEDGNGTGTQIAYKLDRGDQDGDNSKLWTMKIRASSGLNWSAWENVPTSIPKGHYPVSDCNLCIEDGMHYYAGSTAKNLPPATTDGVISVYSYNTGTNENQSANPFFIQVFHSWWQERMWMRRYLNGQWGVWKELLIDSNSTFYLDAQGLKMAANDKWITTRHIEGTGAPLADGGLLLNYHNKKPVYFWADNGTLQTLQGLFQSASNGKTLLANTLTGQGVPTSTTASWQTISENIKKVSPKPKVIHITHLYDNPPQYCRVEWGRSGLGYSLGEYQTRLVFQPPKPIKLALFEVVRNGSTERTVEYVSFGGDWRETDGIGLSGDNVYGITRFYAYCIPKNESLSWVSFSMSYNNSIQQNILDAFRWLGVTSIKITYFE